MKKSGPILVLSAGILWGIIGIFVRRLTAWGFDSMQIVAVRAWTTVVLLGLYLLLADRTKFKVKLADWWCFVGTGLVSVVFFNFCYFKAITLTSLSVAAVLLYTAPAFVTVFSALLFREKITRIKVLSLISTFVGCALVSNITAGIGSLNLRGILLGLGAGLGYALYSIFSRFALQKGYHPLTISFYTFLIAAVGTLPFAGRAVSAMQSIGTLWFCLLFGLITTVLPYITYTSGLDKMQNSQAAIIASIEPVTATLLGVIVFGEAMTLPEIAGVLLVLGAIIFDNLFSQRSSV